MKILTIDRAYKKGFFADKADWSEISRWYTLSEDLIEKFADRVDWKEVCYRQKLSERLIEKFADKVDWKEVCRWQTFSEEFIEKFADRVNWESISRNHTLSEEFIEKFADKVDWEEIYRWQTLSEGFIKKMKKKEKEVKAKSVFRTKSGLAEIYEIFGSHEDKKSQFFAYFCKSSTAKDYLEMLEYFCDGDVYIHKEAIEIALKNKSIFEYIEENFYFDDLFHEKDVRIWAFEANWFQHRIEKLFKVEDNSKLYYNLEEFIEKEFSTEELDEVFQILRKEQKWKNQN